MNQSKLRDEFTMRLAEQTNDRVTLEASPTEIDMLAAMLSACLEDPETVAPIPVTTLSEERMSELNNKIPRSSENDASPVTFQLSKEDFFDLKGLLSAVETLDPEIYFPKTADALPPDDDMEAFINHIDQVYLEAFPLKLE